MMMVMRAGGEFILNISEAGARCGAGGQAAAIIYKQTTLDWIGISIRMSIAIRSTNINNINKNNMACRHIPTMTKSHHGGNVSNDKGGNVSNSHHTL